MALVVCPKKLSATKIVIWACIAVWLTCMVILGPWFDLPQVSSPAATKRHVEVERTDPPLSGRSRHHASVHPISPLDARNGTRALPQSSFVPTAQRHVCNNKLYTPTYVTHIAEIGMFAIVDCWHHRAIVSRDLDADISEWADLRSIASLDVTTQGSDHIAAKRKSLEALKIPHSLASNGKVLVTESSVGGSNGDNHSVLVFRFVGEQLVYHSEVLGCDGNRARRPHRVIYDEFTKSFFLYMTSPAHIARFVWDDTTQTLVRKSCHGLPFMKGMYARSIVALNGSLYITAGPGVVTRTELDPASGLVVKRASYSTKFLGFMKGKMNDLAFFDGWWYATSTVPCAMVRFRDIHRMWEHEKIHTKLGLCAAFSRRERRCLGGTPYFVSKMGDRIYVPYIFGCSGMVSFRVGADDGQISDVRQHWGSGWVEDEADLACRGSDW